MCRPSCVCVCMHTHTVPDIREFKHLRMYVCVRAYSFFINICVCTCVCVHGHRYQGG
jgi:hypothetical protein